MKSRIFRTLAVGAAALGAVAFAAGPASAGDVGASLPGAWGSATFQYDGKYIADHIYLTLADTAPDGHHVQIRVQSETTSRVVTSYAWRSVTTGADTEQTWVTSLQDNRGIWAMRIQVCVYEGSTQLGCDESSWDGNPAY
ncbi:hypothetical protein [Streptomyces sp. NPDC005573]|uniref:hypothetical protein n=1 Tax=unclassified Streptomyces TaxID=2593676 RepID=UPI0033AC95DA